MPSLVLTLSDAARSEPEALRRAGIVDPVTAAGLAAGIDARAAVSEAAARPLLDRLHRRGLLAWQVEGLASAVPLVAGAPLPEGVPDPAAADGGEVALSRFALLHREPAGWLLESGRSDWQVRCTPRGVAALTDLSFAGAEGAALLSLLALAGVLASPDDETAATTWGPHDRYFAARSRRDTVGWWASHGDVAGAVDADDAPPPALRRNAPAGPRVPLPAPDGPAASEPLLWQATEGRRTVRAFGSAPVSLDRLGGLLWRTLRVVDRVAAHRPDGTEYEGLLRPVPSGGALHALDLWLLCPGVEGVGTGAWWYDPFAHELVSVPDSDRAAAEQISRARTLVTGRLAAVGLLTARERRAAWKYGGIAYALQLKDVGVVMHSVQLTAGALGLGMCPLGSGATRAIADLLGIDPEADAPVGEFLLGPLH